MGVEVIAELHARSWAHPWAHPGLVGHERTNVVPLRVVEWHTVGVPKGLEEGRAGVLAASDAQQMLKRRARPEAGPCVCVPGCFDLA